MKMLTKIVVLACICAGITSSVAFAQATRNEKLIAKHAVTHEKMLERLLKYIKVESWSLYDNVNNDWTMTEGQAEMAALLASDAKALGAEVTRLQNL